MDAVERAELAVRDQRVDGRGGDDLPRVFKGRPDGGKDANIARGVEEHPPVLVIRIND